MKIIIVGAGIAGLAAAVSLHEAGLTDVSVYERSATIRGLGVGINLLPHAMRELTELGVADAIAALGVAPTTLAYFNRFGQAIWSEPRGVDAGYRWPQLSVHRGRLQLALRDLAEVRLADPVRLGHRLIGITSNADGTETARFATDDGEVTVTADVIIGADGIHSALRALRYPAEGAPSWNGLTVWRGVTRIPAFLDGRTMIMAGDGEQKFVAYPLSDVADDGRMLVNFIAEKRIGGSADADWNRAVDPAPIAELFREWSFDWLDVPAAISAADEILEYPMVDRDALPQWTFGRTTLIGDAAHAMYPNGSNGGSQAILDARMLALHLATADTIDEALSRYEDDRRPAMTTLLAGTRATGPERVMLVAAERAPEGFEDIDDVVPASEREQIAADYKKAAGFLPEMLNERSSLSPVRR
ncbi:2-polyprenyl-6-methoxyphenol hydroxylase-like FAD-dependent oxidoreductase [Microbacterium natoriense]|uniref:2-polyprenyl-6-methoxyphenol hydroxylase-like FAD-dependent oxidoreductase n=1 Tax=Microbacterium natoriense TaxID=284570 RepID=A0AAW8F1C6_9MICO|nr:flavin-dependent oxidoreductase [Microbacterium natoriense]MDQ0649588.1 2-polyprenyl-6-methoxyphenol hydroxylase-like FAD-dependent oxidoreductase [Microbacterium natoriense]